MVTLIINQFIFAAFNIGLAWYHAILIKKNKPIKHGWWAASVLIIIGLFALINPWYIPVLSFLRQLVFDPFLSKFRGLPWSYRSNATTSIIDKIENKIFPTWKSERIFYFILFLISESLLIAF